MGIGTGTAAIIGGLGAAGSIGSAAIGSNAASNAAAAQEKAAQQAAQLQAQGSNNALNYQNGIYNQTQQNLNPFIGTGLAANSQLGYLLGLNPQSAPGGVVQGAQGLTLPQSWGGQQQSTPQPSGSPMLPGSGVARATAPMNGIAAGSSVTPTGSPALPTGSIPQSSMAHVTAPINGVANIGSQQTAPSGSPQNGGFGSLTQGYGQTFQAPTDITEQNDPGYQARLKLGTDAIQRSAAARGNVLTGGTAKALDSYGQDYASNEYGNVYNRALQTFGTNYGVWNNDQNNIYNRLLGLSNSGQQGANTLGALGQSSAGNVTSNLLGTGQQIGQDFNNAGAANASGIVGSGNAWQNGLSGSTNNLSQLLMLQQLGIG